MNDDNYVEWLVKRKDPAYAVPVKILMIVVCIFSVLSALQTVFGVIVMTIAGVATYFVFLNLSVEFEYLFAEGGLSVTVSWERQRERRYLTVRRMISRLWRRLIPLCLRIMRSRA